MQYADIIIPLNIPQTLTYGVPLQWQGQLQPGMRVEVSLGRNKLYSGVVFRLHDRRPETFQVKPVKSVIDTCPVVLPVQLRFWEWIAQYYLCSLGEVMQAALPAHLKLMSESLLIWNDIFLDVPPGLSDDAFILAEALLVRKRITIQEARQLLQDANLSKAINEVLSTGAALVSEVLEERYKAKKEKIVLLEKYYEDENNLEQLIDKLSKQEKQLTALILFLKLRQQQPFVTYEQLVKQDQVSASSIATLIKNDVLRAEYQDVDRLLYEATGDAMREIELSPAQQAALDAIKMEWENNDVTLLQGVTGSGKTLLYIQLIKEAIAKGRQSLFLLPEIALTTQLVSRLKNYFGEELGVYHSRFSNNERVEIWNKVKEGKYKVVLGPRSALWLPFEKLDRIIVDEEHDASYKQQEPAPRFHARDAAIYLASLHKAKVLLGSATPSVESLYNAQQKKYGFVSLKERYRNVSLPAIEVVPAKNYQAALSRVLTTPLLEAIHQTVQKGKQVILFQNKRGYAPFLICSVYGFVPHCKNCDVSLTYHKASDKLHCHYCGTRSALIRHCPQCGNAQIVAKSFGTEKIEEELQRIFPKMKTARMDWDSIKGKNKLHQIIDDFARGRIDILVGTQMVVKGLDFEHIGLVGILSADSLWSYPDFRINERAFQLIQQVSGRAGRSDGDGRVMIQAHKTDHPVLGWVRENDFRAFYQSEIGMRQAFAYPPFTRFIKITCKHRDEAKAAAAAKEITELLVVQPDIHIQGPAPALVPRVRNMYLHEIWLKLPRSIYSLQQAKAHIVYAANEISRKRGNNALQVIMDVDTV